MDLTQGPWIKVANEWKSFDEIAHPEKYIMGKCEGYGCDTGCTGYVLYLVDGEHETRLDKEFYFVSDEAISAAERLQQELCLPIVMTRDWS